MKLRLMALQARMAEKRGKRVSVRIIAADLGVSPASLFNMSTGKIKSFRGEYIDAICAYAGMTPGELLEAEPATWPLAAVRPDRKRSHVGERTRGRTREGGAG